jgi:hypothetical protein
MIEDGAGTGKRAQVNNRNRLVTETVTFDREDDAISFGLGYQVASLVTYTSSTETAVMYFKNLEDQDVVLDRVVLMISSAVGAGATDDWTHKIVRNPESGTIIDNAVLAGISNSNHGSANVLNGDGSSIYKGVQGDTLLGGTGAPLPIQQASNRILFPIGRRIPKNSSYGVVITPPPGTTAATSVTVCHVFVDTNQLGSSQF